MHRILCVEDAPDTVVILQRLLNEYEVVVANSLHEARQALDGSKFNMAILDVELPDGSGLDMFANSKEKLANVPVLFLTGKKDFATKASAFSLGADDFIQKPFDPRELKLRIESKLKKYARSPDSMQIGGMTCAIQEQRLYSKNGERHDLTSLELRILILMAQFPGKAFSRAEIISKVWGAGHAVSDRSVDVHVSNLRKKLDKSVCLDAVVGSGYRLSIPDPVA